MCKHRLKVTSLIFFIFSSFFIWPNSIKASEHKMMTLQSPSNKIDVYPYLYILKDPDQKLSIQDIVKKQYKEDFILSHKLEQHSGFFETTKWLWFDINNNSDHNDWLLEFAFPLIYHITIYSLDSQGNLEKVTEDGANFPFNHRKINHRNFVYNIDIERQTTKTFFVQVKAGGDLHPPIIIWDNNTYIEKTQREFILLGLFYGMILIMIIYNLFLFISLRIRSYLYYVLAMIATMMGQLSINGLSYQYIWSNYPFWNLISTPFWVSLACIFILIFTRRFLDTDNYLKQFKPVSYIMMFTHLLVILTLFISHVTALNMMLVTTFTTFIAVLSTAFICLNRGARQARFFILGWVVFLIGVFITIIERAAILPYSLVTEYAGQATFTFEVVILSFALADKINMMRVEKERAEQQALESQQLAIKSLKETGELKDEFLAITSHEIRTPLYGMIGIAESIRDGVTGNISPAMKHQLSLIITSGKRLTSLVNDILDFSQLKHNALTINLAPINLSGLIDVVLTICQPLVKNKPIRLVNCINSSDLSVYADQNRLQQIIYNLVGNAIKYTDEGKISISAEKHGDLIKISVTDTGRGISEELQQIIFEPFKQENDPLLKSEASTGIGLSIAGQLVDLHGGTLEVSSRQGIGSTFSFTLPINRQMEFKNEIVTIKAPSVVKKSDEAIQRMPYDSKVARILIVDDEPINLHVLTNQLLLKGYDVLTAINGEEALNIIEEQAIDLLILDIMLPKMSGYDVCIHLRKKYTLLELPILMLTAKSQIRDRITAFKVGANDYLAKPCDKQELLSRVKTLVHLRHLNMELITMNTQLEKKVIDRTKELKVANEDLIKMNHDLTSMSESRGHLLANIAHELGTPVTLINSYIQAVQQGLVTVEDPYFTSLVFDKIKVLSRLISDLSDLSKLEAGHLNLKFKYITVDVWLDQVNKQFEFDIERYKRTFHAMIDLNVLKYYSCMIDLQRMDQVFSNIIWNAVKNTTHADGEIIFSVNLSDDKSLVIMAITDNGYGIPEENIPHIFDRFFIGSSTSHHDHPSGTGLGLAIVKEIIDGHGGTIWVDSELNKGTTFYLSLPIELVEKDL